MIEITALKGMPAAIGYIGENEHRVVVFPEAAEILAMYPGASVTVMHMRPGDRDAYPVSPQYIEVVNGVVKWTIQSGDLARQGNGKCEVIISCGDVVAKTMIYKTVISPAIGGGENPPEPWTGWTENVRDSADLARGYADGKHLDGSDNTSLNENNAKYHAERAAASAGEITGMTAQATTLQPGSSATANYSNGVLTIGVPAGADGTDGTDGTDGVSPTISVTDITGGHRVTITDATGAHSFDVMDGSSGGAVSDVQINGTSILDAQGVANVPVAGNGVWGVTQPQTDRGIGLTNGKISINPATTAHIKNGNKGYFPVCTEKQHLATFYGLAKAAGADMANLSGETVGVYPEAQKSAISTMLNGSVSVSGTTPSITALPGVRYVCGECSTLDITLPASGCIDVVFESGSTATVLTITPPTGQTLKWANGFDPTSLEANTTYEINICDGLGVAGSWT